MANEYINRVHNELGRNTPEGFKASLDRLEAELKPKFIDTANAISDSGEAAIVLPLAELSMRLRVMSECLQPRAAVHNIGNLLTCVDLAMAWPKLSDIEETGVHDLMVLSFEIVHSPERVRREMEAHRLITHRGERLLKKIDRESDYYRLPEFGAVITETEE